MTCIKLKNREINCDSSTLQTSVMLSSCTLFVFSGEMELVIKSRKKLGCEM